MNSSKWDNQLLGGFLGFFATVVGFFVYGVIYTNVIQPSDTMGFFINELFLNTASAQPKILSLSLLAVVPVFFLCNYLEKPRLMRGILSFMFLMAIVVVILLF